MKRGILSGGTECFMFGEDNKLKIFPPNTFNFKPKSHIHIDEIQGCLLDNLWYQYQVKRDEKGYMLSNLNSLAEYFNMVNKSIPKSAKIEVQREEPLYIMFDGSKPGIYMSWEEVQIEKFAAKRRNEELTFKKYDNIDDALKWARLIIGLDYYIDPKAKEYIKKRRGIDKNIPSSPAPTKGEASSSKNIKKEEPPKYHTYQECLLKGIDPLDSEYIDQELDKRFEDLSKIIKKELKEEILKELREEIDEKIEEIKTEFDNKYDFHLSDGDHMDVAGHGQPAE